MKLPQEVFGPPQIVPRTPLLRLQESLRAHVIRGAQALSGQFARPDARIIVAIAVAGIAAQALWLYIVPFAWGWDTTPNLAIGRMYFGLPYEMWNIKYYYAPGYPVFLTLLGLHHLDTLTFFRIGTLFVGGLMPLLLYLMLRPFNRLAAIVASLIFALSFGAALFSTDMMNHHFHAFLLLLMSVAVAYHLDRPSNVSAILLGCAAAFANTGREVTMFIFAAGVFVLFAASWIEQRNVLTPAKSAAIMIASFVALTGAFSVARTAALGEPFRFGLTYDVGARVLFQGAYYGASIYQKEFHPGEDFVFIRPENGPVSKQFFEVIRTSLAGTNLKDASLSDANDIDEAMKNLIAEPNHRNTYTVWFALDKLMSPADGDRLLRKLVFETGIAHPRILRYYLWNFWTYLLGPPMIPATDCLKCVCPPCFGLALPGSARGSFMGTEIFSKMAGPGVISEMAKEHERGKRLEAYAWYLYADARLIFAVKPVMTILLLASVFLARGKMRLLMIYCVAAVLIIGGTTSLGWPVQARYQYPAIPFVLAGASVSIFELLRRIAGVLRPGAVTRESAG
jgi:hypothetical protein